MGDSWDIGASDALERFAPEPAAAAGAAAAAAWGTESAPLLDTAAGLCAAALGLPSLTDGPGEPLAPAVAAFTEQFCVDVASTTDAQRAGVIAALGANVGTFVQGLWVADFWPRSRAVLDALFTPGQWAAPTPTGEAVDAGVLWGAANAFLQSVARFATAEPDGVGQLTAELVRLRGASQHQCRLCASVRNRSAIAAGGSDDLFAAVDDPAGAGLSEAQRAAIALADTLIWTPGHVPPATVAAVQAHYTPSQAVALVLWVTRNASNKIAVALAGDAPHVTEGVEIYDLDAAGEPVYGLSLV